MKICDKCGAHNADNRMFCIDCDETLGDKLSAAEEEKARASVNGKIEKMCNERDPLYVSKFDKIMGSVSAVGAVLSLLLALASIFTQMDGKFLLCAVLFFLISTLEALVPQVTWAIEKFRMSFTAFGTDDLIPSNYYLVSRKIAIVSAAVLGVVILVMSIIQLF